MINLHGVEGYCRRDRSKIKALKMSQEAVVRSREEDDEL